MPQFPGALSLSLTFVSLELFSVVCFFPRGITVYGVRLVALARDIIVTASIYKRRLGGVLISPGESIKICFKMLRSALFSSLLFSSAYAADEGSCDGADSPVKGAAGYMQSFDSYTLTYVCVTRH